MFFACIEDSRTFLFCEDFDFFLDFLSEIFRGQWLRVKAVGGPSLIRCRLTDWTTQHPLHTLCTMHYALHMYCTHCSATAHHAHCTHCIRTQHIVCSTYNTLHKCTLSVSHWTIHCSAITVISLTTVHYTRRSFVLHCLKEDEH